MWILDRPYTTFNTKHRIADLKQALSRSEEFSRAVLIVLDTAGDHHLEIVDADDVVGEYYPGEDLLVIGVAESKPKAEQLLVTMIDDVAAATGGADARTYFREQWESGRARKI